jgi:hypothetical protein
MRVELSLLIRTGLPTGCAVGPATELHFALARALLLKVRQRVAE